MHRFRSPFSERKSQLLLVMLGVLVGALLAANFLGTGTAYGVDQKAAAQSGRAALYDLQNAFTSLAEEILPSVVSITSKRTVEMGRAVPWFDEEFFKNFPFPFPRPQTPDQPPSRPIQSYGSGVIVRSDGYVLTNDHVVGGADKVVITLKDGREFDGTVSRDPRSDLALVKIDAKNLPAAKLGDSSKVKPGQWAIAVGSPFGLEQTVTVGVVSAVGRQEAVANGGEERFYPSLIQTDASINPGNSGGPLVNIDGEIIGINTLIRSSFTGGNIGIGFAIPANTAKFVLDQLITHGKVTRGYLGIDPGNLTPKTTARYGVQEGALVEAVEVGTPADKAGVQVEDVIVEFNDRPIRDEMELRDVIAATPPGTEVTMVVVRDKARKTLKVTLSEAPSLEAQETPKESPDKLGFNVADVTPDLIQKYKLDEETKGVVVTKLTPGSAAMEAGLAPGQVIIRANGEPVTSVEEFNAATKVLKSGDAMRLRVQTKERTFLVEFTLD